MTVDLRVQPRARRAALEASGGALKAQVTAPPEDGKANQAVIALLADAWHLPKSSFDASLLKIGDRAWLVTANYEALLAYNCAHTYALSVATLASKIAK